MTRGESASPIAGPTEIGAWVGETAGAALAERAARIRVIESDADSSSPSLAAMSELETRGHSGESGRQQTPEPLTEKTQLTSTDRGRPRNAFAGPAVPLLVTAALLCGGGLAYAWMSARAKDASLETSSEVAAQSAPPAIATSALVVVDLVPPAIATSAPIASASVSASGPRAGARPPAPTDTSRLPPRGTGTVKTLVPPAASQCSPPYFFDSEGIKHPKKECM